MSKKSTRRRTIRYTLLGVNFLLLILVVGFVLHVAPTNGQGVGRSNAVLSGRSDENATNPLDQLSSADIAVYVSNVAHLPESYSVANHADTVNAQLTIVPADNIVATKPQIVGTGLKSRSDIQTYVVQKGDSVTSIANHFDISADTVRWSNNLSGDSVDPGKQLIISPINGIVYLVKHGDTVSSIANKYHADKSQLIVFNDLETSGLPFGQYIVIPAGTPPNQVATTSTLTNITTSAGFAWGGGSAVYSGNGYDYGYCTYWAALRRSQVGRAIPSNLGNASTWKVLAQRAGLSVGNTPRKWAVIWTPPRDYYGHVGFVESVNSDGSVNISEMNVVGWGVVDHRTLTRDQAAAYSYIY